eukprot:353935-Chlamydomonas_euryale.AAC.6
MLGFRFEGWEDSWEGMGGREGGGGPSRALRIGRGRHPEGCCVTLPRRTAPGLQKNTRLDLKQRGFEREADERPPHNH